MWAPAAEKNVTRWSDVRGDWPDNPIALFGPGSTSGTFDYFSEVVVGSPRSSRTDYTPPTTTAPSSMDQDLIRISGIPMTAWAYELVKQRVANRTAGSIFADGRTVTNIELALSTATP